MADEPKMAGRSYREGITEENSFDELSKGLAQGTITRGRALKLGGAAILGSMLSIFALPEVAEAKKKGKVTLCHNGRTIRVSRRAVKAHRRHGDTLGPCPPPPPPPPTCSSLYIPMPCCFDGTTSCRPDACVCPSGTKCVQGPANPAGNVYFVCAP